MGYMQEFEVELRKQLSGGDTEATVKWIKQRLLDSYRNGLAAQKEGGRATPDRRQARRQ